MPRSDIKGHHAHRPFSFFVHASTQCASHSCHAYARCQHIHLDYQHEYSPGQCRHISRVCDSWYLWSFRETGRTTSKTELTHIHSLAESCINSARCLRCPLMYKTGNYQVNAGTTLSSVIMTRGSVGKCRICQHPT